MPPIPRIRVVVDADACVPPALLGALDIVCAPAVPSYFIEPEPIPFLITGGGPIDPAAIAEACAAVAEPGEAVIYIRAEDGLASPDEAAGLARAAVEARGATFRYLATNGALMGAGWAAVRAAECIARGGDLDAAFAAAEATARRARVIAMLEHPEMAGILPPGRDRAPGRMVVRIEGAKLPLLGALPLRETALAALRDRFGDFAAEPEDSGRLRVAIHHAAAEAGATALATWAERRFSGAEVVIAPLTRHAATRLGPGMIGIAWLWEPEE